jgi:hypothetical protein
MTQEKFLRLLEILDKKAEAGRIAWESTPDEYTFRTWIGEGAIRISGGVDDQGRAYFSACLINDRDEVADELVVSKGEPGFTPLERLFNAARRKARSADELLDSMLGQLAKT